MSRPEFFWKWKCSAPVGAEHCNDHSGLHCTGNLAGTEAASAHMNVCRGAVHDCLHALDVGLPGAIGATVRVGNLDSEGDALTAEITFGHVITSSLVRITYQKTSLKIIAEKIRKIKKNF